MIGNGYHDPRIIPVGAELPPMEPRPERSHKPTPGKASEPKGKAGKRSAGERFRVLNNFVDFTPGGVEPSGNRRVADLVPRYPRRHGANRHGGPGTPSRLFAAGRG